MHALEVFMNVRQVDIYQKSRDDSIKRGIIVLRLEVMPECSKSSRELFNSC